MQMIRKK